MKITETYEHIRSIYALEDGSAYYRQIPLGPAIVEYGLSDWPSRSYLMIVAP